MAGSPNLQEEQQLIVRILAGEKQPSHVLISPYERSVYVMAQSFVHNEADAEEVAQEGFPKSIQEARQLSRRGEVRNLADQHHLERGSQPLRRKGAAAMESLDKQLYPKCGRLQWF